MENPKPREEKTAEPLHNEEKPVFKSSFKNWIRIVAFIVVAVFLPEQVAQAIEYDWRVLWQKPGLNTFTPSYTRNIQSLDIPLAVRNILKDISGKPINAIRLSPDVTVQLEKPLNISKKRIEEIYNWLKGRPCGSKALYDYLRYQGKQVEEQDIAVMSLTVDILNDVVKPEGNPTVIKNSLYALSQASRFFGEQLYPAKIDTTLAALKNATPFIAHLKVDHYIFITSVTDEKVYYVDEHREEFLPIEKFLQEFSGYALIPGSRISTSNAQLLTDNEAKQVLGARSYYSSHMNDVMGDLMKPPDWKAAAINLGIGAAFAVVGGGGWAGFCVGQFAGSVGQNVATFGYRNWGWSANTSQIMGYVVSGGINGAYYGATNGVGALGVGPGNPGIGAGVGAGVGFAQGHLTLYFQKKLSGIKDEQLRYGLASFLGSAGATIGVNGVLGGIRGASNNTGFFNGAWTGVKGTFYNVDQNGNALDAKGLPTSDWRQFQFTSFTKGMITQGIGFGVEYELSRKTEMKPEYSRMLGQAVGAFGSGMMFSDSPRPWFDFNKDGKGNSTGLETLSNAAMSGLVNAGVSYGLTYLADSVKDKQTLYAAMPTLQMLGSSAIYNGYRSFTGTDYILTVDNQPVLASDLERQGDLAKVMGQITSAKQAGFLDYMYLDIRGIGRNISTYGGTAPIEGSNNMYLPSGRQNPDYVAPYMQTYNLVLMNAKVAEMFGLDLLAERAKLVKESLAKSGRNPNDWRKMNLFPVYITSLNNYLSSTYHDAAADTLTKMTNDIWYSANMFGVNPHKINPNAVNSKFLQQQLEKRISVLRDPAKDRISYQDYLSQKWSAAKNLWTRFEGYLKKVSDMSDYMKITPAWRKLSEKYPEQTQQLIPCILLYGPSELGQNATLRDTFNHTEQKFFDEMEKRINNPETADATQEFLSDPALSQFLDAARNLAYRHADTTVNVKQLGSLITNMLSPVRLNFAGHNNKIDPRQVSTAVAVGSFAGTTGFEFGNDIMIRDVNATQNRRNLHVESIGNKEAAVYGYLGLWGETAEALVGNDAGNAIRADIIKNTFNGNVKEYEQTFGASVSPSVDPAISPITVKTTTYTQRNTWEWTIDRGGFGDPSDTRISATPVSFTKAPPGGMAKADLEKYYAANKLAITEWEPGKFYAARLDNDQYLVIPSDIAATRQISEVNGRVLETYSAAGRVIGTAEQPYSNFGDAKAIGKYSVQFDPSGVWVFKGSSGKAWASNENGLSDKAVIQGSATSFTSQKSKVVIDRTFSGFFFGGDDTHTEVLEKNTSPAIVLITPDSNDISNLAIRGYTYEMVTPHGAPGSAASIGEDSLKQIRGLIPNDTLPTNADVSFEGDYIRLKGQVGFRGAYDAKNGVYGVEPFIDTNNPTVMPFTNPTAEDRYSRLRIKENSPLPQQLATIDTYNGRVDLTYSNMEIIFAGGSRAYRPLDSGKGVGMEFWPGNVAVPVTISDKEGILTLTGISGYRSTAALDGWGDLSIVSLKFDNRVAAFNFDGEVFDATRRFDSQGVEKLVIAEPDFAAAFRGDPYRSAVGTAGSGVNLTGAKSLTSAHVSFIPGLNDLPFRVTDPASIEGEGTYTLDFKGVPNSANPALAFNLNFNQEGSLTAAANFGPGTQLFIDSARRDSVPFEGAEYFTSFTKNGVMGVLERTADGFSPRKSDNHIYQEWAGQINNFNYYKKVGDSWERTDNPAEADLTHYLSGYRDVINIGSKSQDWKTIQMSGNLALQSYTSENAGDAINIPLSIDALRFFGVRTAEWNADENKGNVSLMPDGKPVFLFKGEGLLVSPYLFKQEEGSGSAERYGEGTYISIKPSAGDINSVRGTFGVLMDERGNFDANTPAFSAGAKWTVEAVPNRSRREVPEAESFHPDVIAGSLEKATLSNVPDGRLYHDYTDWTNTIHFAPDIYIGSLYGKGTITLGSLSAGLGTFTGSDSTRIVDIKRDINWKQDMEVDKEGVVVKDAFDYHLDYLSLAYAPEPSSITNGERPFGAIDGRNSDALGTKGYHGSPAAELQLKEAKAAIFGVADITVTDKNTKTSQNKPAFLLAGDFLKISQVTDAIVSKDGHTVKINGLEGTVPENTDPAKTYNISLKDNTGKIIEEMPARVIEAQVGGKTITTIVPLTELKYGNNPTVLQLKDIVPSKLEGGLDVYKTWGNGVWGEMFGFDKQGNIETQPFTLASPAAGAVWIGVPEATKAKVNYNERKFANATDGHVTFINGKTRTTVGFAFEFDNNGVRKGVTFAEGSLPEGINEEALKTQLLNGKRILLGIDRVDKFLPGDIYRDAFGNSTYNFYARDPFRHSEALDLSQGNVLRLDQTQLVNSRPILVSFGSELTEESRSKIHSIGEGSQNFEALGFDPATAGAFRAHNMTLGDLINTNLMYCPTSTVQLSWQNKAGDFEVAGASSRGWINRDKFGVVFGNNIASNNTVPWEAQVGNKKFSGTAPLLGQQAADVTKGGKTDVQAAGIYGGLPVLPSGLKGTNTQEFARDKLSAAGIQIIATHPEKQTVEVRNASGVTQTVRATFDDSKIIADRKPTSVKLPVDAIGAPAISDTKISVPGGWTYYVNDVKGGMVENAWGTLVLSTMNPATGNLDFSPITNVNYNNALVSREYPIEGELKDKGNVTVKGQPLTAVETIETFGEGSKLIFLQRLFGSELTFLKPLFKGAGEKHFDLVDNNGKVVYGNVAPLDGNKIKVAGFNLDGSFAIPWSINANIGLDGKTKNFTIDWVGGVNNPVLNLSKDGKGFENGTGQLSATILPQLTDKTMEAYYELQRNNELVTGGERNIPLKVDRFIQYLEYNNGEAFVPKEKVYFNDSIRNNFGIWENYNGWQYRGQSAQIADERGPVTYYDGLSFMMPSIMRQAQPSKEKVLRIGSVYFIKTKEGTIYHLEKVDSVTNRAVAEIDGKEVEFQLTPVAGSKYRFEASRVERFYQGGYVLPITRVDGLVLRTNGQTPARIGLDGQGNLQFSYELRDTWLLNKSKQDVPVAYQNSETHPIPSLTYWSGKDTERTNEGRVLDSRLPGQPKNVINVMAWEQRTLKNRDSLYVDSEGSINNEQNTYAGNGPLFFNRFALNNVTERQNVLFSWIKGNYTDRILSIYPNAEDAMAAYEYIFSVSSAKGSVDTTLNSNGVVDAYYYLAKNSSGLVTPHYFNVKDNGPITFKQKAQDVTGTTLATLEGTTSIKAVEGGLRIFRRSVLAGTGAKENTGSDIKILPGASRQPNTSGTPDRRTTVDTQANAEPVTVELPGGASFSVPDLFKLTAKSGTSLQLAFNPTAAKGEQVLTPLYFTEGSRVNFTLEPGRSIRIGNHFISAEGKGTAVLKDGTTFEVTSKEIKERSLLGIDNLWPDKKENIYYRDGYLDPGITRVDRYAEGLSDTSGKPVEPEKNMFFTQGRDSQGRDSINGGGLMAVRGQGTDNRVVIRYPIDPETGMRSGKSQNYDLSTGEIIPKGQEGVKLSDGTRITRNVNIGKRGVDLGIGHNVMVDTPDITYIIEKNGKSQQMQGLFYNGGQLYFVTENPNSKDPNSKFTWQKLTAENGKFKVVTANAMEPINILMRSADPAMSTRLWDTPDEPNGDFGTLPGKNHLLKRDREFLFASGKQGRIEGITPKDINAFLIEYKVPELLAKGKYAEANEAYRMAIGAFAYKYSKEIYAHITRTGEVPIGVVDDAAFTTPAATATGAIAGSLIIDFASWGATKELTIPVQIAALTTLGVISAGLVTLGTNELNYYVTGENLSKGQLTTIAAISLIPYAIPGVLRIAQAGLEASFLAKYGRVVSLALNAERAGMSTRYIENAVQKLSMSRTLLKSLYNLEKLPYALDTLKLADSTLRDGLFMAEANYLTENVTNIFNEGKPLGFGEGIKSLGVGYLFYGGFNGLGSAASSSKYLSQADTWTAKAINTIVNPSATKFEGRLITLTGSRLANSFISAGGAGAIATAGANGVSLLSGGRFLSLNDNLRVFTSFAGATLLRNGANAFNIPILNVKIAQRWAYLNLTSEDFNSITQTGHAIGLKETGIVLGATYGISGIATGIGGIGRLGKWALENYSSKLTTDSVILNKIVYPIGRGIATVGKWSYENLVLPTNKASYISYSVVGALTYPAFAKTGYSDWKNYAIGAGIGLGARASIDIGRAFINKYGVSIADKAVAVKNFVWNPEKEFFSAGSRTGLIYNPKGASLINNPLTRNLAFRPETFTRTYIAAPIARAAVAVGNGMVTASKATYKFIWNPEKAFFSKGTWSGLIYKAEGASLINNPLTRNLAFRPETFTRTYIAAPIARATLAVGNGMVTASKATYNFVWNPEKEFFSAGSRTGLIYNPKGASLINNPLTRNLAFRPE
ncbi:MAG: hypothetical protein ABSB18_08095, partial [Candidatus Omnitrophota bacterium]